VAEKQREYAKKNREQIAKTHHKRYMEVREARLKQNKEYRDNPENTERLKTHRRQYYIENKAHFIELRQAYTKTDRGRAVMKTAHQKEKQLHGHKIKARYTVSNALRDGRITRPDTCRECGVVGNVEAHHHEGYDRENWLNVEWLCVPCHKKADAKQAL